MTATPSPWRTRVVVAALATLLAVTVLLAAPRPAAAATINPMAAAGDFTVKTEGDGTFDGVEVEGSLAIGGDYAFHDNLPIIHSSGLTPSGYAIPTVDGDPTRLLVRGTFDAADSTGVSEVSSRDDTGQAGNDRLGYVKIGDLDALQVTVRGSNAIWIADGASGTEPGIYDPNQPYNADPNPAEGSRVQLSDTGWDDYFDSIDNTDDVTSCLADLETTTTVVPAADADQVLIPITEGATNVLEVTPDSPLFNPGIRVVLNNDLGPDTTLVIKLVGAEDQTVSIPRFEAANDTSAANPNVVAPYVLWDLSSNAGSTVELTGEKISGSIYAPGVDLVLNQSSPFEGTVISETIFTRASSGELHHYPFEGTIECDQPSPSPTPSESTPTESPSTPTESPSTPTESPSTPTESPSTPTVTPSSPTASETTPASTTSTTTSTTTTTTTTTGSSSGGGSLASTGARAGLLGAFVAGIAAIWAGAALVLRRRGHHE